MIPIAAEFTHLPTLIPSDVDILPPIVPSINLPAISITPIYVPSNPSLISQFLIPSSIVTLFFHFYFVPIPILCIFPPIYCSYHTIPQSPTLIYYSPHLNDHVPLSTIVFEHIV